MLRSLGLVAALLAAFIAAAGMYIRSQLPAYREAFFYAYGPYEFSRSMQDLSGQRGDGDGRFGDEAIRASAPDWQGGPFLNRHVHNTSLADHTLRSVTTPNNDTLYSSAVLELSAGPVELVLPAAGDRYQSVALMDVFTDQFAHLGPSETEGAAHVYWIVGPASTEQAPEGVRLVRATSNDVWLLARTFVAGPDDLGDAVALQQGIGVRPVYPQRAATPFVVTVSDISDADNFLAVTNEALARNRESSHVARGQPYTELGIGPDAAPDWLDRLIWGLITPRAESAMREEIDKRAAGRVGWSDPPRNLGFYGDDDTVRAVIALMGFGALRPEHAMYFMMNKSEDGQPLDGGARYQITIPADVPTQAFWSMTLYEPDGTGRLFFYENATGRHSLNSGSPGLVRNADGSITLSITATAPDGPDDNWLPTPSGPFTATFRLYLPAADAVERGWTPPVLERR